LGREGTCQSHPIAAWEKASVSS